jgi:hypothetical protein
VTAATPAPPPIDAGLEQLLRRMRLPHMRRIAPEVLATAKAQRWDPTGITSSPKRARNSSTSGTAGPMITDRSACRESSPRTG